MGELLTTFSFLLEKQIEKQASPPHKSDGIWSAYSSFNLNLEIRGTGKAGTHGAGLSP